MNRILTSFLLAILSSAVSAQNAYVPFDENTNHLIDRYAILNQQSGFKGATAIKPFNQRTVVDVIRRSADSVLPSVKEFNYQWLTVNNWDMMEESMQQSMYTKRSKWLPFFNYTGQLFTAKEKNFNVTVNPVIGLSSGMSNDEMIYRNTRGVTVRGQIDNKVGFHTFISENQFFYPDFINSQIEQTEVIPGTGLIKTFGNGGYDFFQARGYITFKPTKSIDVQFGHDRNFIGNGYRSLILSDFAKENLFLKLRTRVWRVDYMNLFSELSDYRFRGVQGLRKKYAAFHYLNLAVIPGKLHVGVFENIVFARNDSTQQPGYEFNYLNPIIFYRAVEHGLNSSDNSFVGFDAKWNALRGVQLYSQFVLDEFHKNEIFGRTGSWVNKWAAQFGMKYLNVAGVSHLDLQVETNLVRPYMYTHFRMDQNWTHYNQPMAHPLGANFKEFLTIVRYQVKPRWSITAKYFNIVQGADSSLDSDIRFGGNVLATYRNRAQETGIEIGDGVKRNIQILDVTTTFQLYQNLFFDARYVYRNEEAENPLPSFTNNMIILSARFCIDRQRYDY